MPGFDPKQPRDPEGKWIDAAIAALPKGKKIGIHGHVVDNIPSKGYRVRLKGVGSQHYQKPEHAAQAVRSGRHSTPESQKVAEASQEAAFRKTATSLLGPSPHKAGDTVYTPAGLGTYVVREGRTDTVRINGEDWYFNPKMVVATTTVPEAHPSPKAPAPAQAHEFGQWARQTAAKKAAIPASTKARIAQMRESTKPTGPIVEGSRVIDANGKTRIVTRVSGNSVYFKGGGYADITKVKHQASAPVPSVPQQRQHGGQTTLGPNYGHVTATGVSPANPGYSPSLSDKELDAAIRRAREQSSPMLSMFTKIKETRQRKKVVSGNFGSQLRQQKRSNWIREGA